MNSSQMSIIVAGIKNKLKRGDVLEDILSAYTNLTNEEKDTIRQVLQSIE